MKYSLRFRFVIYSLLIIRTLNAQFSEKQSFVFNGNSYEIFIIKQDSLLADKCSFADAQNFNGEKNFFTSYSTKPFFAITTSIVDSNCNPLGLFIKNGQTINALNNSTQGLGSFYSITPNGIFYITKDNEFNISPTPDFLFSNPPLGRLAIQSGPILVNKGSINTQFTKGSKNKFTRCGVGITTSKNGTFIIFAKSNTPVNFYDFADLFLKKYDCNNALNLESGFNCSIQFPSHSSLKFNNKIKPCRYFIIAL